MMNVIEAAGRIADAQANPDGELTEAGIEAFASLESYAEHVADANDAEDEECAARTGRIDQLKARIAEWEAQNKYAANRKARRLQRLGDAMRIAGLAKLKTAFLSASFKTSCKTIVDVPGEELPLAYQRIKTTVEGDKAKIKAAIEGGECIDGCRLEEAITLVLR